MQCGGVGTATNGHSASTCNTITSTAAALEWTVAFLLVFYFLTLVADLWPAGKSSPRYMRRLARWQMRHGEGQDFTGRRAFGEHPDRWRGNESAGVDMRAQAMERRMHERNEGVQGESQRYGYEEGTPGHWNGNSNSTPRASGTSTMPLMRSV